jgi:Chemotaxis response regulator containing a CheY-like receiver domain and a methylesterase domain
MRTLIVDDEPLARDYLCSLLEAQSDITIIGVCQNGREAIKAIRADRPELVFWIFKCRA